MKTLIETIEKLESASNVTDSLLEKTNYVARKIERLCLKHGIKNLLEGKYSMRNYSSIRNYNSVSYEYNDLELKISDGFCNLGVSVNSRFVDSNRKVFFRNGEYSTGYGAPNRDDIKTFINDIPALFADIERQIDDTDNNAKLNKVFETLK